MDVFPGFSMRILVSFGGGPSVKRQNRSEPLGVSLASGNFAMGA